MFPRIPFVFYHLHLRLCYSVVCTWTQPHHLLNTHCLDLRGCGSIPSIVDLFDELKYARSQYHIVVGLCVYLNFTVSHFALLFCVYPSAVFPNVYQPKSSSETTVHPNCQYLLCMSLSCSYSINAYPRGLPSSVLWFTIIFLIGPCISNSRRSLASDVS